MVERMPRVELVVLSRTQPARNAYHSALRTQTRRHWKEWLEDATECTVWQAHKYANQHSADTTASRVPDLETTDGTARSNADKCDAFKKQFFPEPPPADLSDINDSEYPDPTPSPDVEEAEVRKVIDKLPPLKAPGGSRSILHSRGLPTFSSPSSRRLLTHVETRSSPQALEDFHYNDATKTRQTVRLRARKIKSKLGRRAIRVSRSLNVHHAVKFESL
jgi:hypothetical protein